MPNKIVDKTNRRYGRLTVLKQDKTKTDAIYWVCKCDCGNYKSIKSSELHPGRIKSCGCLREEVLKRQQEQTHGEAKTRLYSIWRGMKKRCYQPTSAGYKNYGGRGITVYEDWLCSYENFRDWAYENGYEDGLSLDRINVNENYTPSNCKFSTYYQQVNNKRTNRKITYKNIQLTVSQWCTLTEVPKTTFYRKIKELGEDAAVEWAINHKKQERRAI